MSDLAAEPVAQPDLSSASGGSSTTVSYQLVSSYSTVQVLSPTMLNEVVYCTIQTMPSKVTASRVVQQTTFDQGQAGEELSIFAQGIEEVMTYPHVTAGVGSQVLEDSGLLADTVVFTVTYTDPVRAPNGATATASVGVELLDFTDAMIGVTFRTKVKSIIDATYNNLKAAAGG